MGNFKEIKAEEKVFSDEEMSNLINLHGIRHEYAREVYDYFKSYLDVDLLDVKKDELKEYLIGRFDKEHEKLRKEDYKKYLKKRKKFLEDMSDKPYLLRGENK